MTLNLPLLVNLILIRNLKSWVQRLSPKYSTQRVTESDVWNWKVAEKEYIGSKTGPVELGGRRALPTPPQDLVYQLTLFQQRWADYALNIIFPTRIFRPSAGSAKDAHSQLLPLFSPFSFKATLQKR